ncbi:hypothetical protein [Actinospongicola halichondriae]|uniref:hypothetical protein n=1 Tax=Actinospongicola halichondriae TaxID=3236844 RepID=UPI003D4FA742
MSSNTSKIRQALAVLALVGAVAACGDDDDNANAPTTTTTAAPDDTAATVDVTAVDYAYEGLPDTIEAGTRLTLANASDTEIHELVAFRIPDDETRSIDELVTLPPEELLGLIGPEPATVLLAPPGGDQIPAVGDGTLSEPGRYGVICVIPTGADPVEYLDAAAASEGGPPEVDGGPPHITQGMFAELLVE